MDFLSKQDLLGQYGLSHPSQLEKLIGEKGKKALAWKPGRQRFSPKQVRKLHEIVGKPLSKAEKYA